MVVLMVWAGAIALFFNRWGKIRMLLPYQPDYKQEQLKVPGTGVCASGNCNGQHSHQVILYTTYHQLLLDHHNMNSLLWIRMTTCKPIPFRYYILMSPSSNIPFFSRKSHVMRTISFCSQFQILKYLVHFDEIFTFISMCVGSMLMH